MRSTFWDSNEKGVQISVAGKHVTVIDHAVVETSLSDALKRHSDAFGLRVDTTGRAGLAAVEQAKQADRTDPMRTSPPSILDAFGLRVDTTGPADEVWCRLKEAEAQLSRERGLLSRVFGKTQS
jgi:hypothetical protein